MKIVYLLICACLCGTFYAQRTFVQLEVAPKEVEVGQSITITVKANIQGELEVDLPKSFESGNSTMSSMQQEIDYNSGKVITYFIHSQNGSFSKSGSFTIGPAYIKRGNKVYKSNISDVSVKKENNSPSNNEYFSQKQLAQVAFGNIQLSKKTVYEGEAVLLSAKIYARFSPTHLEGYEPYEAIGSLEKHALNETSEQITLKEENLGRLNYYTFSYDKRVVFPYAAGKVKIEPFHIILMHGFESFPLTSSAAAIEVKSLPKGAPSSFNGGVGSYNITQQLSSKEVKQGDIVTLHRTITGKGNLHTIKFPKLNLLDGLALYGDPEIKEQISFGNSGAEGKLTCSYHLKATKAGIVKMPSFLMAYFDPEKEKYIERKILPLELKVTTTTVKPEENTNTVNSSEETFHALDKIPMQSPDASFLSRWIWIVLTLLFGLLTLKLYRDRRKNNKIIDEFTEIPAPASKEKITTQIPVLENAGNHLINAQNALQTGDLTLFYAQLEKAMLLTLSANFNPSETNRRHLLHHLEKHPKHLEFISWFADLDASRYGMGINETAPSHLLERAEMIIEDFSSI